MSGSHEQLCVYCTVLQNATLDRGILCTEYCTVYNNEPLRRNNGVNVAIVSDTMETIQHARCSTLDKRAVKLTWGAITVLWTAKRMRDV